MKTRNAIGAITLFVLMISFAAFVFAQNTPLGAETVTVEETQQANLSNYGAATVDAEAGNVTELSITGVSATKSWQGYYGNISGVIILEDAQGNRFYDWGAAEPQGEVFASVNQTVTWTDVACAPLDNAAYLANWHNVYSITNDDYDNINITYNRTDHPTFYVGYTTFNSGDCRSTYTFVNDAAQFSEFSSVALTTDTNGTLIFTALIEDRATRAGETGFDGADHDFQILVAEDGSNGNSAVTPYYFWVELD